MSCRLRALLSLALALSGVSSAAASRVAAVKTPDVASIALPFTAAHQVPVKTFTTPLSYVPRLQSATPSIGAASGFLADQPARAWLQRSRPQSYPGMLGQALSLQDLGEILTRYENPRSLRDALLARPEVPAAREPAKLFAIIDANSALAPRRTLFELAVLHWPLLRADTRAELALLGYNEALWNKMTLKERANAGHRAISAIIATMVKAKPWTAEFAEEIKEATQRGLSMLTDEELDEGFRSAESARRVAEGIKRAETAIAKSSDRKRLSGILERAKASSNIAEVSGALESIFTELGEKSEDVKPVAVKTSFDERELARASQALGQELDRQLGEDAYGLQLLTQLNKDKIGLRIGDSPTGAGAHYDSDRREIVLSERLLVEVLRVLGRADRQLLDDPAALREVASVYTPIMVHEATHHLQIVWANATAKTVPEYAFYSQHAEREAFLAYAAYTNRRTAVDPEFEALTKRVAEDDAFADMVRLHVLLRENGPAFYSGFRHGYRATPTLARVGARLAAMGQEEYASHGAQLRAVEVELSRRRRLPAKEREAREKRGVLFIGRSLRFTATSILRQWRRDLLELPAKAIQLANAAYSRYTDAVNALAQEIGIDPDPANADPAAPDMKIAKEILAKGADADPKLWRGALGELMGHIDYMTEARAHGTRTQYLKSIVRHGLGAVKPEGSYSPRAISLVDLAKKDGMLAAYAFATRNDTSGLAVDSRQVTGKDVVDRYAEVNPIFQTWWKRAALRFIANRYKKFRGPDDSSPMLLFYDTAGLPAGKYTGKSIPSEVSADQAIPTANLRVVLLPARQVEETYELLRREGVLHVRVLPIELLELLEIHGPGD